MPWRSQALTPEVSFEAQSHRVKAGRPDMHYLFKAGGVRGGQLNSIQRLSYGTT